ncbi:MAG: TlpA family protein disulfide reductase [Flavobacteriales bacterium]|nr:TlpA family protein disulfide reductase [Flavobacteriales bacterium]
MHSRTALPAFILALLLASCASNEAPAPIIPRTGAWSMTLNLGGGNTLPFSFDLSNDSAGWIITVHNGTEHIVVDDVQLANDTLRIRMPLFDSEFVGALSSDSAFTGHWANHLKGPEYRIPFTASHGAGSRFPLNGDGTARDLSGTWETHYSPGVPDAYDAIGIFSQKGTHTSGTFVTETGDYRYLEGVVDGDSMKLSCFDGTHAFLFKAAWHNDSLHGRFWSGTHWQEPWVAVRNPDFKLRDPDSLTMLREGYDMADFSFPGIDGGMISSKDAAHAGRVLMVQIMGSWCPNCVDETLLLDEMYAKYNDDGLSVIALAFEQHADSALAIAGLKRFRERLHVKYDIAYAGPASKAAAAERLPFLDHVMSYPTCIFIDRAGVVRRIRTGFYGPGTGEHYLNYRRNLEQFLERMLAEPSPVALPKAA